jgi:glutathione S-transferase
MTSVPVTLHHSPNTRSSAILWILEEIGQPYTVNVLNTKTGEHRTPKQLEINPMGKVPALQHGAATITESCAIAMYLAEIYPAANLAPPIGDPLRGPFLRWMFFYAACVEPAIIDKALQREPGAQTMSPYGSFDATMDTMVSTIDTGPFMLGSSFTVLDAVYGSGLGFGMMFKIVPERPEFTAYLNRLRQRPAWIVAQQKDADFAKQFDG